jgi:hypothetical protein
MRKYIVELQEVIYEMYGVQSMHVDSVRVTEILEDNTVWDGLVEVFEIHGHPTAPIVYAWAQDTNNLQKPKKYFAVLHLDAVDSREAAVKAAVVQELRAGEAA